jgi:hypothetical protein
MTQYVILNFKFGALKCVKHLGALILLTFMVSILHFFTHTIYGASIFERASSMVLSMLALTQGSLYE